MRFVALIALALSASIALAGHIPIAWDAPTGENSELIDEIRIFSRLESGGPISTTNVPPTQTTAQVSGLQDCVDARIWLQACDTDGGLDNCSEDSMVIVGWPRVTLDGLAEALVVRQGETATMQMLATNARDGFSFFFENDASVVSDSVTDVTTITPNCNLIEVTFTLSQNAPVGTILNMEYVRNDNVFNRATSVAVISRIRIPVLIAPRRTDKTQ